MTHLNKNPISEFLFTGDREQVGIRFEDVLVGKEQVDIMLCAG